MAMAGQARVPARHVPRNTRCRRTSPFPPPPAPTPGRHPSTQEHRDLQRHPHGATPAWTLPAACTGLHTAFSVAWDPQTRWSQTTPKSAETPAEICLGGGGRLEPKNPKVCVPKTAKSMFLFVKIFSQYTTVQKVFVANLTVLNHQCVQHPRALLPLNANIDVQNKR